MTEPSENRRPDATAASPPAGDRHPPTPGRDDAKPRQVVIRDKRRVDPSGEHAGPSPAGEGPADPTIAAAAERADPGELADPGAPAAPEPEPAAAGTGLGAELAALRAELEERTRDLQRERAEYANYRKRVQRDRALATDEALANVFRALLPVFDDLDRAQEHGELSEGVTAVVDQLSGTAGKFGLSAFGEKGDPFDPTRHEAVAHLTSAEVTEPTCVDVLRRGYLLGDRLLRPAMVAVAGPAQEG